MYVIALGTGSGTSALIKQFHAHAVSQSTFVFEDADQLFNRIVVLNRPVNAFIDEDQASIGQGLLFLPVAHLDLG